MADKFVYDGTDYELSRQFDLGGRLGRRRGNELRQLDSGRRVSYTRKIPERTITLRLENASRADREIIERFFFEIAEGSLNKFDLVLTGAWREVLQCGAVISAATIQCGQTISGATAKCGQWATADTYTYTAVRFVDDSLIVADSLDEHADIEFSIVQELEP